MARASTAYRRAIEAGLPDYFEADHLSPDEPSDLERAEWDRVFGRHVQKSWTGLTLAQRFTEVSATWTEDARGTAELQFRWMHRLNNETLHPTSTSLFRARPSTNGDSDALPSRHGFRQFVLGYAFWTYAQTVENLYGHFALSDFADLQATVLLPGYRVLEDRPLSRVTEEPPAEPEDS